MEIKEHNQSECTKALKSASDAIDVLNGRWRMPIIISLLFGNKRFRQIAKEVNGITDKMLSKELKDLELNKIITRTVYDTFPPTVEYSITEHGKSLQKLVVELTQWGMKHRKKIIGK